MRGRLPQRTPQRGSIAVAAAVCITLMISVLAVIDIGFLYYYKREYQKAADLAALSGAKKLIVLEDGSRDCSAAQLAGEATAILNLENKGAMAPLQCGLWRPAEQTATSCAPGVADPRVNTSNPDLADAVRAVVTGTPPSWFLPSRTVSACAIALTLQPAAQLTIRSGLVSIDTQKSLLLNAVVGSLLGGTINLSAGSWSGLVGTDINLLKFLDALAIDLGLEVGNYAQVLTTDVALGRLLGVAADVLEQGHGTGDIAAAVGAIENLLALHLPGFDPLLKLGDLVEIGTGVPTAALDLGLNVLELIQGGAMLANGDSVASVDLPVVGVPGLATVRARIKVIEPPVLSSVGNPELAKQDPYGPDRIFVRTAQVRALVEVDLTGVTGLVSDLTSILSPLLTPLVNFLNSAGYGGLNLIGAVGNLLKDVFELLLTVCTNNCSSRNVVYTEVASQSHPLQVSIDAAAASARVTDYDCTSSKELESAAQTEIARLRIGRMDEDDLFSSNVIPIVDPSPIVEIGYRKVRPRKCVIVLGLGSCEDEQWQQPDGNWVTNAKATAKKYVISGLGVKVDSPVGNTTRPELVYMSPDLPEIWEEPAYQSISTSSVVSSLGTTLANININAYQTQPNGLLGNLLNGTFELIAGLISALQVVIGDVLGKILDPILNALLPLLGVDLATADVGANLTCEGGGAILID